MKKFTCSSLGNTCSWDHIARTEELLTDMVAIHLRQAHGVHALTPEMIARIKNQYSNPSPIDVKAFESLALKEYTCDLGPKCSWHYIAQTEELIADGVAVHARDVHGIREFTPEMKVKVENSLHEWKG